MKKVSIFIDCAKPVDAALKKTIDLLRTVNYVTDPKAAELVIVDDIKKVVQIYDPKIVFVVIYSGQIRPSTEVRENVFQIHVCGFLPEVIRLIEKIGGESSEESATIEEESVLTAKAVETAVVEALVEKPGMPWVLVVDDKLENRLSARKQLGDYYNLIIVEGYAEAKKALEERKFDFALIDLHLPVDQTGALSSEALVRNLGEGIPYGMFLIFDACEAGVHAALVTDLNHHQDPFSAAFDRYSGKIFLVNGKKAMFQHASVIDGAKDWAFALQRLIG